MRNNAWRNGSFAMGLSGNDLPVSYLRLLAPPLQLFSAAMWQVVQQGLVDHYGMLEEFVTMVTELVPELMSYSQRAQLILGLRARLVLELCRGENPVDIQAIQPHLDRIKAPISTAKDHHATINQVEESEVNFVELVHTLLEDTSEREHFFQEIFPVHFGSKYDTALEMLVWEFISRLEKILPVPDFTQMVAWLGDTPSFLDDCLQSFSPPEDMKAILEHHRNLGHIEEKDPSLLPMDDCILSSLSLPPSTRHVINTASHMSALEDSPLPEKEEQYDILDDQVESDSERLAYNLREEQWLRAQGSNSKFSQEVDSTDIAPSIEPEATGSATSDNMRGGRILRKRKLSGGLDAPSKRLTEASAYLDSSLESSGQSPLISIWGEYTDPEEASYQVTADAKVPWSDEETLNLLDIWGKDSVQRVLKGCLKNRPIFTLISQKMAERGYMRTVEQCQTRIKRLKKCFRQCLHNKRGNPRLECKFYDQLERVLGTAAPSAVPEVAYDVDEGIDGDQSNDGCEDWQFLSHTGQEDSGTRSVPWTDFETLALIDIWSEDKIQQELRGMHRTGHIFALISDKMAAQGFSRTAEQCQTRVKRLKTSFRQCYENNIKGREQVECKFYDQLERIFLKDVPSSVPLTDGNSADLDIGQEESMDKDFSGCSRQDFEACVGVLEEKKKVPWSDRETLILLELWGDYQVQKNLRRCPHNGHIFSKISEKLSDSGYARSAEQCHTRIKRLKASYRQCQENMSFSGTDRVDFKFYDLMEQILEKQPSTSSTLVTESIELSEDSSSDSVDDSGEISGPSEKVAPGFWSDEETHALIDIWGEEEVQTALRGFVHNGHVYADISEKMHSLGYSKTPEQCRWKVKSLRNNFRQCYDRKKCGRNKVEYKFYHHLEGILGQEASSIDEYDERDEQVDQDAAGADGTKYPPWSEQETVALIELWAADDVQHSLKTCLRNGHIFAEIANKMAAMGYTKTMEQCQSRMKRLRKTYRRFCSSRRSGGHPILFRYYQLLEPVLGDDSLCPDVDSAGDDDAEQPLLDQEADMYDQASTSHLAESSKKLPWSDKETRALLEVWGEDDVQVALRGCLKNRHVFEYISQKMRAQGFIRTTEQCYTRIKRLKAGFFHDKEEFKFFNQMEEIFSRELKADGSVQGSLFIGEAFESELEVEQKRVNQWAADGSKLPWSDSETEVLLDIWGSEEIQEDLRSSIKNKHIFVQISEAMASQGYLRTAEQCQSRVKRLKGNFRQFIEGRRGGGEKQECKFFDQLLRVLGSQYVNQDSLAEESSNVNDSGSCPSP
ncbi:uncharacterized protein zgc:113263 [Lampris incognitus]|uniref:uncharacterized protein zgc:113263 n=1 Tax=Lampris incognitus TaxID=2546036 RepID=UPI0024B57C1A|nr:uncharacterized protein zgc:113263 [Lampris incognitus]